MVYFLIIFDENQVVNGKLVGGIKKVYFQFVNDDDSFIISVYGFWFVVRDFFKYEMFEVEMFKDVVYCLIKDYLSLDGNFILK